MVINASYSSTPSDIDTLVWIHLHRQLPHLFPVSFDLVHCRDLHVFVAKERRRSRTFIPPRKCRDLKFLRLYGSSDVCREEVARVSGKGGKHSRGKALSQDSNRSAGHEATFESNPCYSPTGNTPSFRDTRSRLWNFLCNYILQKVVLRVDSFLCSRAGNALRRENKSVIERQEISRAYWERSQ